MMALAKAMNASMTRARTSVQTCNVLKPRVVGRIEIRSQPLPHQRLMPPECDRLTRGRPVRRRIRQRLPRRAAMHLQNFVLAGPVILNGGTGGVVDERGRQRDRRPPGEASRPIRCCRSEIAKVGAIGLCE